MKYIKIIVFVPALVSMSGIVLADGVSMMGDEIIGTNMMYKGMINWSFGMSLWWLLGVALGSFIFSVIFWLCYKWLVGDKKKGKRR